MKLIGYYNYTVVPTYIGLAAAVVGIFLAAMGLAGPAVICLMAAGAIDMFDGKIARTRERTENEQLFGIQIDSLCDLVSFGLLPVVIGYAVGMRRLLYLPAMILYVLAAVVRLAYFNVDEMSRQAKTDERRKSYEGLPVTTVALLFPVLFGMKCWIGHYFPIVYAILMILIAVAFVLRFRVPKPGLRGMLIMLAVGLAELALMLIFHRPPR